MEMWRTDYQNADVHSKARKYPEPFFVIRDRQRNAIGYELDARQLNFWSLLYGGPK